MWFAVVAWFFSAAFLLPDEITCSKGIRYSQNLKKPLSALVQSHLDRAVAEHQSRVNYEKLKTSSPKTVTETSLPGGGKIATFRRTDKISLKEALHFVSSSALYNNEEYPTEFAVPIGKRTEKFKLTKQQDGSFTVNLVRKESNEEVDLTDLHDQAKILSDPKLKDPLRDTIQDASSQALDAKLNNQPDLERSLRINDLTGKVSAKERDAVFHAATDFIVGTAITGNTLTGLNTAIWVQRANKGIISKMEEVREKQKQEIAAATETKLEFELTQSMLKTSKEAIEEWNKLKTLDSAIPGKKIIEEQIVQKGKDSYLKVTIHETDQVSLKEIFKLKQFILDIYPDQGNNHIRFEVPIGGEMRKFRLSKAPQGTEQIYVNSYNSDWPGTTKRDKAGPGYEEMVDKFLSKFPDQYKLAKVMIKAVDSALDSQPDFSTELKIPKKPAMSADIIRASVEFLVITMVAEAAQPRDEDKASYLRELAQKIQEKKRFPESKDMPSLQNLNDPSGRSPVMDEVVEGMLKSMGEKNIRKIFTSRKFPPRRKNIGARVGREWLHKKLQGDAIVPSYLIRKRAAKEHDRELISDKVSENCERRRKKRFACSLSNKDPLTVDEESIKITKDKVEFDLVHRRHAKEREHVELKITPNELATPRLIMDKVINSQRAGMGKVYAKVNKGLAVHGLIFSVLGAVNYFQEGDNLRGAISLAQSAHTLAGLTGLNDIISKVESRVISRAAEGLAKTLNLEKGLEKLSVKVEKFAERGVGELLGDIPVVGLAFDIYFIEQDIEQLANLNLDDPDDLKLLPLRVIDLELDVSTTVLNLIGTLCPAAEVVTEPLVIVLSIIRMAIDDFYIDIMAEMEKVNWKSPWAGLEFLGALVKGFLEGAADFLTGGLRRQMESYRKQEEYDEKLIRDLKNPDNYYKIVGEKKGSGGRIDFTQGKLSSFGGYINFRLNDNNRATLEIGDVSGSHNTIRKTFQVGSDVKDIVLGIGESRTFEYKRKTAKLWFVIPIKSYNVICGANYHEKSVYGTYYGNSKDNKFYAVQKPKPTTKPTGKKGGDCNFGKLNLKFVTGNYHYNLYGRGGSDTFYLGPEMSAVTGGTGSDLYIIQSDGGKTIIDNFAEDNVRDIIVINVDYASIRCYQTGVDLHVSYSKSHHIRIKNWFVPGDPTYYRHVSFRSQDGVVFVPKQILNSQDIHVVQCVAVALDLGAAKKTQTVTLNDYRYRQVKQVSGSNSSDNIFGNDVNNILDGGLGADHLYGGRDEDTYIIRANEGCDVIDNDADDYLNTTDIAVFEVPFKMIEVQIIGNDLLLTDRNNVQGSCFKIANWTLGYRHRHILFTSGDHVVFNVSTSEDGRVFKEPIILDYKTSATGVCVDLSDLPSPKCIKPSGYAKIATVSDSPHNDYIVGNAQTNFLSCTGGEDYLEGGEGTDNYVVKKTCQQAVINNFDSRMKADVVYLEETFINVQLKRNGDDLRVVSSHGTPTVELRNWFNSSKYQHLGLRTIDGITLRINSKTLKLEPYDVSKDPSECQCKQVGCDKGVVTYNLTKDPWQNVVRFELKSSHCSYKVYGNKLNNYLDPGAGNGYNYQHLEGRNGSDTYVLNHGYGEFNEINNYADDSKTDTLELGIEFDDVRVDFHSHYDAILGSISRPTSLGVLILDYFRGAKYQHLQIISADKVVFNIVEKYPYKKVVVVDRRTIDSPQNIDPLTNEIIGGAEDLKGSLTSPNNLTGSDTTKEIEGGAQADTLHGGDKGTIFDGKQGNDRFFAGVGNDIIFGGEGDDVILSDNGDDYIYGGDGADFIDGGEGSDTLAFKGDGFRHQGVTVDLRIGFGKGADAEGDTYKTIENVYGTIHNDVLIGADSDNNLFGLEGDDSLAPHGGADKLVGGEGQDSYLLYKAFGLKVIDNYADDEVKDTLSLVDLNSTDVCIFLVGNDLHLQIEKTNLASVFYHGENLAVIIKNWYLNAKYRHLNVLFSNTLWEDFALFAIAGRLEKLGNGTRFIENKSNLQVVSSNSTDVTLSWQPTNSVLSSTETEIFLVHFKQLEPKSLVKRQVDINQTSLTVSSLDPTFHYVFALALTKCKATIAVSHTLITYGRQRPCPAAKIPHSTMQYTPPINALTPVHGTIANVKCNAGYHIHFHHSQTNITCLDHEWIPSLPICKRKKECRVLTKPPNGEVSSNGNHEGSKAYYICHKGFLLNGRKARTCVDETWDGNIPNCLPINCPKPAYVHYGSYISCDYMKHAKAYGTMNSPLEGYCVKLQCKNFFLPSHVFRGKTHRPRWESDWKIPQGGRVCSDGKWIGYVEDTCQPIARLVNVAKSWSTISGLLQLWQNGGWTFASSTPTQNTLILSCKSVGIESPHYVKHGSRSSKILVTCSKLRFTQPKPTVYQGRVEMLNQGVWEGLCVTERGTQAASKRICEALGFNYKSAVVSISTGWTDHSFDCHPTQIYFLKKKNSKTHRIPRTR